MILKKMTARFGMLDGRTLELGDGLNVLYAPNESGKSTWCAFLRTMLYGLPTAQRAKAGVKPDKVKYQPWSGSPMSGSMDVTTSSGAVTLSRWTEKASQPMQAFSATITGTDTPAPGLFSDTVGETLTGVPRSVFERSAFIRQAGLELTNDPELDRRIGAIVSTGDENVSYIEVDGLLRSWLRHRRSGKRGAIPELEADIARTRAKLDELRAQAGETASIEEELAALEEEYDAAVLTMQRARSEQRRRALADMSAARAAADRAREEAQKADTQRTEAESALAATVFGDAEPEEAARRAKTDRERADALMRQAEKRPSAAPAFLPLIAAVAAFVTMWFVPWKAICLGVGGLMLAGFAAALSRLLALRKARERARAEGERLLDAYGVTEPAQIDGLVEDYRTLWTAREQARTRAEETAAALERALDAQKRAEARTLDGLDFTRGDSEAARAGRQVEQLRARIARLREQRASAEGRARATGDAMVLASELEEQRARREELVKQEQALALAVETMAQADQELQQRFSPRLAGEAAALFSRLTGGRYDEVTLARDLTAKARPTGDAVGRDTDYLSAGAKDQLYLALRLAVCELALPGDDPCPIVLDDALVNFDRERMERALALLRKLAEKRQILLFTCHEREYDHFADDPGVYRAVIA